MIVGDCREVLPGLIASGTRYDAIVTDPPYGVRLHGLAWDDEVAFDPDLWQLLRSALKPGAYVAALCSPRTYHRVATAAEATGFTILAPMQWEHSIGMPQPQNLSTRFDRDTLKQRTITGIERLSGVAANNARFGAQRRNSKVRILYERNVSREARQWKGWYYGQNTIRPTLEPILMAQRPPERGRMIDNVRRHGVGALNIDAIRRGDEWPDPILRHQRVVGGKHPTAKPIGLMEDLCRLLCPPGGHILDPFAGSGTTGTAAALHGFRCTMIERDPTFGLPVQQAAE